MIILYVPFSLEDSLSDLVDKVEKWTKAYEEKHKDIITVYHGVESRFKDKIKLALESGKCKIYVLGHGIDSPELKIANQIDDNEYYKELTIHEVAENFKSDLMMNEFSNGNIVKLFFCDEYTKENKARNMAVQFRSQLGQFYNNLEIKYYIDVSVGQPGSSVNRHLSNKGALRHCQMTSDLLSFKLSCRVGAAKLFRKGLNEDEITPKFFSNKKNAISNIKYPVFSDPILRQLADGLVFSISQDKVLSKYPHVAQEVVNLLPTELRYYLANGLTLSSQNIVLQMKINTHMLTLYLQDFGIITTGQSLEEQQCNSSMIDKNEYFGSANTTFIELDDSVSFLPLDDYDDVRESLENIENLPKF